MTEDIERSSSEEEMRTEFGSPAEWGIKAERGDKKRRNQRIPLENYPHHDKLTGNFDRWEKHHGWRLDGIKGMLRNAVGRPWNKVHSEIVAHIKEHYPQSLWSDVYNSIAWTVEEHPMHVGDGVYVDRRGRPFSRYRSTEDLYVDPDSGLLLRPKQAWTKVRFNRPGDSSRWRVLEHPVHYAQNRCYRKINGHWFEAMLALVPKQPKSWRQPEGHSWQKSYREKDWLYQMNIKDAVLNERLHSDSMHTLAEIHGYKTYENALISHAEYQKRLSNAMRSNYYLHGGSLGLSGHSVYATALRQISKAEINRLGLASPALKLPNIVRKGR